MTKEQELAEALEITFDTIPSKEQLKNAAEKWKIAIDSPYRLYADKDFQAGTTWMLSLLSKKYDWKFVSESAPPLHIEVLAKSPEGIVHLCSWREAYDIFTVQEKSESSFDWQWKLIE